MANSLKASASCDSDVKNDPDHEEMNTVMEVQLHNAVEDRNFREVEKLVELFKQKNVDLNYKFHAIGWTPLHCAVNQDDLSIVELLVDNGAQIEFTGEIGGTGETPLHFAAGLFCGDIRIVSYLVEKGANIEAKDDNGLSPLHHSAYNDEHGGMDERVPQYLIVKL